MTEILILILILRARHRMIYIITVLYLYKDVMIFIPVMHVFHIVTNLIN